jgi:phosphoserine phosphatase
MEREEFVRRIQRLKAQLADFEQSGREFLRSLPEIPDQDFEEEATREAEASGALECLLADDLEPALRKLGELEELLAHLRAAGS